MTEQDLIDHCRTSLARFKVPTVIEFRSELPRTIIGKVLRRALRDGAEGLSRMRSRRDKQGDGHKEAL